MKNYFLLSLLPILMLQNKLVIAQQSHTVNKLVVEWYMDYNFIYVTMKSPAQGWVAIGFNTKDALTGTNLIMASVIDNMGIISDQYISGIGIHTDINQLGGISSAILLQAVENNDGTHIEFKLPLQAADDYHQHLFQGQTIYLLMAYSLDDDFMHHSIMRTSLKIIL